MRQHRAEGIRVSQANHMKQYAISLTVLLVVVTILIPCVLSVTEAGAMAVPVSACIAAPAQQECPQQASVTDHGTPRGWPPGKQSIDAHMPSIDLPPSGATRLSRATSPSKDSCRQAAPLRLRI